MTAPARAIAPRRGGAALLLVLLILALLSVAVLESLHSVETDMFNTVYFRSSLQAETIANSGVQAALATLCRDLLVTGPVDHPQEMWATGEMWNADPDPVELKWAGEREESGESLESREGQNPRRPLRFEAGVLSGRVVDEKGKFPVNYLVDKRGQFSEVHRRLLERILKRKPFRLGEEKIKMIVLSLKDWLDGDNSPESSQYGAESEYYTSLPRPYECKNGPLSSLSELLMVRGMTRELYEGENGEPGLRDIMTLYSDGTININTAHPLVLQGLAPESASEETAADFARAVVRFRRLPANARALKEPAWFKTHLMGFKDLALPAEILSTGSVYFSVHMTGTVGTVQRSVVAYVQRLKPSSFPLEELPVTVFSRQVY